MVGHDDVDGLALDDVEGVGGAGDAEDLVIEAQQVLDAGDDVGLVVDDQDRVPPGGLVHPKGLRGGTL